MMHMQMRMRTRTEEEMLATVLALIDSDERIRAAWMNGSRVNPSVTKDVHRDYDIVFAVEDTLALEQDRAWLACLGTPLITQEPDLVDSALCAKLDIADGYTWLMLFDDFTRIDLHICPLRLAAETFASDSLTVKLADKDGILPSIPPPSDSDYHVKRPTAEQLICCANEFWWCQNNVAKGIVRRQLPYSMWMYSSVVHVQLLRLLSWRTALESDFTVSVGKAGKYLEKLLSKEDYASLVKTYPAGDYASLWSAMDEAGRLFTRAGQYLAKKLGYTYPIEYDTGMRKYIDFMKAEEGRD